MFVIIVDVQHNAKQINILHLIFYTVILQLNEYYCYIFGLHIILDVVSHYYKYQFVNISSEIKCCRLVFN